MFLHSGASLHGHEYSNRPASPLQPAHNARTAIFRSGFPPPKQRLLAVDGGPSAPALRPRPASDYIPRDASPAVGLRETQDDLPPTPATHDDDDSASDSELSDTTFSIDSVLAPRSATRRRPYRDRRKSTMYFLGYPAPRLIGRTKVMQKVFLPRLLLQLQKVSEDGRSHPVLEVFPASRIAGPVAGPRLAKRCPGIFGVKRHLGFDDIVLLTRDDSDRASDGADSDSEESLEKRDLVALYSPRKHSDEAEIVLDDGSVWTAKPLANGSWDFVHTDATGNTTRARWARRNPSATTPTSLSTDTSASSAPPSQTRYTFSILNPLSRRHPVMATLTPSALEVQDTYTSVSPSHGRRPPATTRTGRSHSMTLSPPPLRSSPSSQSALSSLASSTAAADCQSDSAPPTPSSPGRDPAPAARRTVHPIDDATKRLISVTAIWVALRSGWSQSYNAPVPVTVDGAASASLSLPAVTTAAAATTTTRGRRNTWTRASVSDAPRLADAAVAGDSSQRASSMRAGDLKRYSLPAQHKLQQLGLRDSPSRDGLSVIASSSSCYGGGGGGGSGDGDGGGGGSGASTPVVSRTSTPVSAAPNTTAKHLDAKPRRVPSSGAGLAWHSRAPCAADTAGSGTSAAVEPQATAHPSSPSPPPPLYSVLDKAAAEARHVGGAGPGSPRGGPGRRESVRSRLAKWIQRIGSSR